MKTPRHLRPEAVALAKQMIAFKWRQAFPGKPQPTKGRRKAVKVVCWQCRKIINQEIARRKAAVKDLGYIVDQLS